MKPRLLLLSYAFPPVALPEAPLSAKRVANLPDFDVDVICAAPFGTARQDHSLDSYLETRFGTVERLAPAPWVESLSQSRLSLAFQVPDLLRFLNRQALAAAMTLDPSRYAAVLTWSQWHSVHLAGLAMKRRFPDLPWIAHFSDPWSDNPLAKYGAVLRAYNRHLEERVLSAADCLSFTSQETIALVLSGARERYRAKAFDLPHAFDPALYGAEVRRDEGPLMLRYLGNFYSQRTPEPLFLALHQILRETPEILADVAVEIVGDIAPKLLDTPIQQQLPKGLVTIRRPVTYRESTALMRASDLLMVIDAPLAESVFLPSKLVDYIGAARPILGLTPPGAAARVITQYGGPVAHPGDAAATAKALREGIALARAHRGSDYGDPAFRESYSAAHLGAAFGKAVGNILGPGRTKWRMG